MAELIKVNAPVRKPLFEGVQGENEARSIQFDITPWVEELGDGAVTATAKRSQDSQPYPVTVTKDGTTVTWKPTSTDTAFAGVGSFQLEYTVDSVLAKTCIWSTMVAPSLDPAGDPPDPYDNWLAEMRSIEAAAIQAADDAEDSADAAAASAASIAGDHDELVNIRIGADGTTYANAGDAVRGQVNGLLNIKDGKIEQTLPAKAGIYIQYTDGAVNSNANYSAAFVDNNARIKIPEFCKRIEFNINIPAGSTAGWATYSKNTGGAAAAFVRGGLGNYIEIQDGDKYFGISSYKINGVVPTSYDITFVFDDEVNIIEGLKNVANLMQSEATIPATTGFWVGSDNGVTHSIGNARYSATELMPIPFGATKVEFPSVTFNTGGTAGWAVYGGEASKYGTGYKRGGQTNVIEFEEGDKAFIITDYKYAGALTSIPVKYTYGEINEELVQTSRVSNNGYKVVMLGDSLIGNYDGADSIPAVLSELTKATCYNCAFGGSSMGSDLVSPDEYLEAFNGWKIINAITTNDYSVQQTAIDNDSSYQHLRANYQAHLNTLENIDWSSVDIITLSYGTNDWGTKVVLNDDAAPKSTDTFMGAFRTALETLWGVYPHIKVIAFGVVWRALTSSGGVVTGDSDDGKYGRNWYLREFEEGIKTVCAEYHVPFVPMYDYTNFNKHTWSNYFGTDLTHPNAKGRFVMAKRYAHFLMQL